VLFFMTAAPSNTPASVSLGPQVFSQKVIDRILLGDPALECHSTWAADLEQVAVRRGFTRVGCQRSVPAVKRDELLDVIGKVQSERLWRQRGCIGSERHHVFDGELFNGGFHERTTNPCPNAVLEIVELANDIAR